MDSEKREYWLRQIEKIGIPEESKDLILEQAADYEVVKDMTVDLIAECKSKNMRPETVVFGIAHELVFLIQAIAEFERIAHGNSVINYVIGNLIIKEGEK